MPEIVTHGTKFGSLAFQNRWARQRALPRSYTEDTYCKLLTALRDVIRSEQLT